MVQTRQNFNTIDLLKLFFAICIVGIHTALQKSLGDTGWWINQVIFRLGVPYFFVVSGYFLGLKLNKASCSVESKEILKNYRKRLFPSFLFWSMIGLAFIIYEMIAIYHTSLPAMLVHIVQYSVFYQMNSMWYVSALIVSSWLIGVCGGYRVWVLAIAGYIFALLANNYYFVVESSTIGKVVSMYNWLFISARNGVFLLIFPLMGVALAKLDLKKIKNSFLWLTFLASFMLLLLEVYLLKDLAFKDDRSLYISQILLIPTIVLLAIKNNVNISLPYKDCRAMSVAIYYSHKTFNNIESFFFGDGFIRFITVLPLSIAFYCITKKHPKFNKWLLP